METLTKKQREQLYEAAWEKYNEYNNEGFCSFISELIWDLFSIEVRLQNEEEFKLYIPEIYMQKPKRNVMYDINGYKVNIKWGKFFFKTAKEGRKDYKRMSVLKTAIKLIDTMKD